MTKTEMKKLAETNKAKAEAVAQQTIGILWALENLTDDPKPEEPEAK